MSLRRCKSEIDAKEFASWKAYYRLEPWGDDWQQAAMIASVTHNNMQTIYAMQGAAGGVSVEPDYRDEGDFMPQFGRQKKRRKRLSARDSEAAARARYG